MLIVIAVNTKSYWCFGIFDILQFEYNALNTNLLDPIPPCGALVVVVIGASVVALIGAGVVAIVGGVTGVTNE